MNANVVVKEVLAEAKTTTFAATSPTKPSEESTYTANRDDGERMTNMREGFSEVTEKLKNAVIPGRKNVFAKGNDGEYEIFSKVIAEQPAKKAIKALRNIHNDKRIAQLILHAKTEPTHYDAAVLLENAQMKYWLDNKKSAKDVFELLELNEVGETLLVHSLYSSWSTYVETFNTKYPLKKVSVVRFLTPTYYDDVTLAHVIVNGKKHEFSKSAALQLEKEQLTKWQKKAFLLMTVFEELGLRNTAEGGLLTHPLFGYWYTYFETYTNIPKGNKEMISFLKNKALNMDNTFEEFLKE
ncbi:unnamed protein product [Peronospora destructor]|uniref:RxLR effector PexRD54 WY domain-containing protein n=1 Tax=Peronospora destructor TaxID=86335 RepID=A0AAV0V861_9STRA|nr:unnamed protein product [Peronospora destructor]